MTWRRLPLTCLATRPTISLQKLWSGHWTIWFATSNNNSSRSLANSARLLAASGVLLRDVTFSSKRRAGIPSRLETNCQELAARFRQSVCSTLPNLQLDSILPGKATYFLTRMTTHSPFESTNPSSKRTWPWTGVWSLRSRTSHSIASNRPLRAYSTS